MTDRTAIVIRVTGRVQGVWFRAWTRSQAETLGVSGWVRNCPDGTVEALLCGPPAAVDSLVAACRRGPPAAQVAAVEVFGPGEPCDGPFTIEADRSN
jgi:acylphosphatase